MTHPTLEQLLPRLALTLSARQPLFDPTHQTAVRLFNGFWEGCPGLVIDLFGTTLVLLNYANPPAGLAPLLPAVQQFYLEQLPWLTAVLLKTRHSPDPHQKQGVLTYGQSLTQKIQENGVWYALELQLNQDSSFYLDTRHLREWLKANMGGKTLLNTFAYTGSLGVAAAGVAQKVVHLDLNRQFLNVAKTSYTLNGYPIHKENFQVGDFWPRISHLKNQQARFEAVLVDPPYFSDTAKGRIDLVANSTRVLNKVRPLIADQGWLITINNALFVDGRAYLASLEALCADGYLTIEEIIPVPADVTGTPETRVPNSFVDPAPFNHSTKMVVLRVRRKNS